MRNKFSAIAVLISILLWFISGAVYYPKWNKSGTEATISWDVSGYYWYLPAAFIYKDLKTLESAPGLLEKYQPSPDFQQAFKHEGGNYIMKYSSGLSICMLPAFIAAHISAPIFNYPQDGFSLPYNFALWFWGLIISATGLFLMRSILLLWFSDIACGLSILMIALATNFLEYAAITNGMTHNYLFTLYALLIWLSIKFYKVPAFHTAAFIGLTAGLMTLIRPTEIISVLIPFLWGVTPGAQSLKNRLSLIFNHVGKYLLAGLFFIMVIAIQALYWKYVSGEWLVYSYGDQGFSWFKPHITNCLFSAKAGWLTYTPAAVIMIAGFFFMSDRRDLFTVSLIYLIIFAYITFAWDIWWYGGSLGQRALIHTYPLLMFPLASLFDYTIKSEWKFNILTLSLIACFHFNFWLHHQAHKGGLLRAGEMTKAYFWAILLKSEVPEETLKLLDTKRIFTKEIIDEIKIEPENAPQKDSLICLSDIVQFSPVYKFSIPSNTGWIRVSAKFSTSDKEWESWRMTQMILKYDNPVKSKHDMIRIQRLLNAGEEKTIHLDSRVDPDSKFAEVYFWNASGTKPLCYTALNIIWHPGK